MYNHYLRVPFIIFNKYDIIIYLNQMVNEFKDLK